METIVIELGVSKGPSEIPLRHPVLNSPISGSGFKNDNLKPIYDNYNNILKEFPATPKGHGFPDIVDNYASYATKFPLRNGAHLYQIAGSNNGVTGRFEWIVDGGRVTHRMFVTGGTINGIPILP